MAGPLREQLSEIQREMAEIAVAVDVTLHAAALHVTEAAARDQGGFLFCPPCRYTMLGRRLADLATVMHDPRLTQEGTPANKRHEEIEEQLERDAAEHAALKALNLLPAPLRSVSPARGRKP